MTTLYFPAGTVGEVNPPKLKEWLAKPSTQQIFKEHNFVPTRYTFEPLSM